MTTDSEQNPVASGMDDQVPGDSKDASETDIAAVEDPLAAVSAERDRMRDQLLRTTADFDNFRKRSRREIEDAKARGKDDTIRDFLPIFDNLERAVTAAEGMPDVGSVVEGVKMVLRLFEDTAQRMGLTRTAGVGERFDPNVHEAIQQQETDELPAGTIVAEVAPGYLVGERLLRAGMVVVARPKKVEAPEDAG